MTTIAGQALAALLEAHRNAEHSDAKEFAYWAIVNYVDRRLQDMEGDLRKEYARHVIAGLVARGGDPAQLARSAFVIADEMVKAGETPETG